MFRFRFLQLGGAILTITLDEAHGKHSVRYREGNTLLEGYIVSREDVISLLEMVLAERLPPVGRSPLLAPNFPSDVFARLAHI